MKLRWQLLLSFLAAVLAGAAYGHFVLAPGNLAPVRARPPEVPAATPVPVAAEADAGVGDEPEPAAKPRDDGEPDAEPTEAAPGPADAGTAAELADTMVPEETAQRVDSDPALIKRGPGQHARLDLRAAGIGTLLVREGRMERDGDGRFGPFARNPVVARLRGDAPVRVELLHLGFDRDGHATVAHIRTLDPTPVEGVASLKHRGGFVAVLPDEPLQADVEALEQP